MRSRADCTRCSCSLSVSLSRSRNRAAPRTRNGTPAARSAASSGADWALVRYSTAVPDHGAPGWWAACSARATAAASSRSEA